MRSFVKIKPSRNDKLTLSFINTGKSCIKRDFFTSLMCLLKLFANIKFSRKFPNLQYIASKSKHHLNIFFSGGFHVRFPSKEEKKCKIPLPM